MNRSKLILACALLGALTACSRQLGHVLGKTPSGETRNIIAVRAGETLPVVALRGTIVEKCPTAGCWFYLQDETGTIKVDTKSAGFVVVDLPLQTLVTVSGRVVNSNDDVTIEATGLRY